MHIHVPTGPAPATIITTAAEIGADVIAMVTHGAGGITRLLVGSIASSVIQQADMPILVVRSTEAYSGGRDE